MIEKLCMAGISASTLLLLSAFGLARHWIIVLVIALAGILWWYGWRRKLSWISSFFLVGFILVCVLGLWIVLNPILLVCGLVAALTAWDLERFHQRIERIDRIEMEKLVIRKHLMRLGVVNGAGLAVGIAALMLRINLDLFWILVLGLIAVVGLTQVYSVVRKALSKQ
jgi:hypothetical protein